MKSSLTNVQARAWPVKSGDRNAPTDRKARLRSCGVTVLGGFETTDSHERSPPNYMASPDAVCHCSVSSGVWQ